MSSQEQQKIKELEARIKEVEKALLQEVGRCGDAINKIEKQLAELNSYIKVLQQQSQPPAWHPNYNDGTVFDELREALQPQYQFGVKPYKNISPDNSITIMKTTDPKTGEITRTTLQKDPSGHVAVVNEEKINVEPY